MSLRLVKTVYKCLVCLDSGWVECDGIGCTEPEDHGAYCRCDIGLERQLEEAG